MVSICASVARGPEAEDRMASKSQINFSLIGKGLLLVAVLLGAYLSRDAAKCIKDTYAGVELHDNSNEAGSGGVINGDRGSMRAQRNHNNQSVEESQALAGSLADSTMACVEQRSFSQPRWAFLGFWGGLVLGVLMMVLDRMVGTRWKRDLRAQSRARGKMDKLDVKSRLQPMTELPPGERARVTGNHRSLKPAEGPMGMRVDAIAVDLDAADPVDAFEDMLQPTSHSVRASGSQVALGGAARREAPVASSVSSSDRLGALPLSGRSASRASDPHLEALGLGPLDDDLMAEGADFEESHARASADVLDFGAVDFGATPAPPSASASAPSPAPSAKRPAAPALSAERIPLSGGQLGGSISAGPSASGVGYGDRRSASTALDAALTDSGSARVSPSEDLWERGSPDQGEEDDFDLELDGDWAAEEDSLEIDFGSLLGTRPGGARVESASVSSGEPFPGSVLPGVTDVARATPAAAVPGFSSAGGHTGSGGFSHIPATSQGVRRIYVAPLSEGTKGTGSGGHANDPVVGLSSAVARTRSYGQRGERVELRLLPGLYREQVQLGPNMVLVNDALPLEYDRTARVAWLASNEALDAARHVVLALPLHAAEDASVLELTHAHDVSVSGVHIVGRGLVDPGMSSAGRAVRAEHSERVMFRLCAFVGHSCAGDGGAVHITGCGGKVALDAMGFEDCLIYQNSAAGRGGAGYMSSSTVTMEGCIIQDNLSRVGGGGLYLEHTRMACVLQRCRLENNRVDCGENLPPRSQTGWTGEDGHGGGVFLRHGDVHMVDCGISENVAHGAGGGVFSLAGRVFLEGTMADAAVVVGNRALRGGGVLLSGLTSATGMAALKASGVQFGGNEARESGGAVATIRMAVIDTVGCAFTRNAATSGHGEGGAIHATVGSRVKLEQTRFAQNRAGFRGGALSVCNSSLRMLGGCSVVNNQVESGDCGGVAFYTAPSTLMDDLDGHARLEMPLVCAIAECEIEGNSARKGVAGLFIGSFQKESPFSVAFTLRAPALVRRNALAEARPGRPSELVVLWKGRMVGSDERPPRGKKTLT